MTNRMILTTAIWTTAVLAPIKIESAQILFSSAGRIGMIDTDQGADKGIHWLEFTVPNQASWGTSGFFPDGDLLLLSMEPRRDGPGKPFDEYYTQTPTHLWKCTLPSLQLTELATQNRMAPFYTPALIVNPQQMLVQVVKNRVGQIYLMNLDGSDTREFTRAGEGLPYGLSLSPDGRHVAFHLASPEGYQVWTSDLDGRNRHRIAGAAGHLYFGTSWSPDGNWIVYHDCHHRDDPGHDWSDLCIGRPDGSEHRILTKNQSQWFGVTYGSPDARGGGSNLPVWTPDGQILFSRRLPKSQVAWQYRVGQPDLDHFNREFRPNEARGGTVLCRINPRTGKSVDVTPAQQARWDFRARISPDGSQITFCRATTGSSPTLWLMNSDGTNARQIAHGRDGQGIDHPRWMPMLTTPIDD